MEIFNFFFMLRQSSSNVQNNVDPPPKKWYVFGGGFVFLDFRILFLAHPNKIWHDYSMGQCGIFGENFLTHKPKMTKKFGFQNSKPGQILSQFAGFLYKLKLFCHLWVETPKKFFVNFFTNNLTPKNFFYAKNQK